MPNQSRLLTGKKSKFKFYWCGSKDGQGGTGIRFSENWVDKVFQVLRISDRIILIKLVIRQVVFSFVSVYAPQTGLPESAKQPFYDQLQSAPNNCLQYPSLRVSHSLRRLEWPCREKLR